MSTRKDVEDKLRAMESQDLYWIAQALKLESSHAREGDDVFIQKLLMGYDNNPTLKVLLLRELGLPTADEAMSETATKALDAAQRSARAAERSAIAAEKSEQHAKSTKHARWVAIALSSAALFVTVAHVIVNVIIAITKGQQ